MTLLQSGPISPEGFLGAETSAFSPKDNIFIQELLQLAHDPNTSSEKSHTVVR